MESKFIKNLAATVADIDDAKIAENFLRNLLTPNELEEIARRLEIFKLLKQGLPQRTVAEKLQVSIGTVSRGARELKYGKQQWWQPSSQLQMRR